MWGLGFPPAFHLSVQLAAQVDYTSKRRETFNPKVLQFEACRGKAVLASEVL